MYKDAINIYWRWHMEYVSFPPKIDGQQGKAMKSLLKYLQSITKDKSDQAVLDALSYVFFHWDKLDDYTKSKTTLSQINQNIVSILTQLKNGKQTNNKGAKHITLSDVDKLLQQQQTINS